MATNINNESLSAGFDSDRGAALQGNLLNQQPYAQGYPQQQPYAQGYPQQQPYAQGYPQQQPYAQGYPQQQPYAQGYPQQQPYAQVYPQQVVYQVQPDDKRLKIVEIDQAIASQFSLYSCILWIWFVLLIIEFLITEILFFTVASLFQEACHPDNEYSCQTSKVGGGLIAGIAVIVGVSYLIFIYFQWQGIVALRDKISSKARCYKIYLIVVIALSFSGFITSLSTASVALIFVALLYFGVYGFLLYKTLKLIPLLQERDLLLVKV